MTPKTPPMDCDVITNVPCRPHGTDTMTGASAGRAARPQLANWSKGVSLDYPGVPRPSPTSPKTEPSCEQSSRARRQAEEPHLYRDRRLDLSALARRVLPRKAAAIEGAGICRLQADFDRDQRHLLRLAEAGELSQMGARGAGRLHFLAEGAPLCHQPPRAGRGRRFREALLRLRRPRARRSPGAGGVAIRANQEVR